MNLIAPPHQRASFAHLARDRAAALHRRAEAAERSGDTDEATELRLEASELIDRACQAEETAAA